jgi:urease gamma subunit
MRININETLNIYLSYIINQLQLHKKSNEITSNLSKLLSPDQVMIGVPESLRKINFKIIREKKQKLCITIKEPISTSSYVLSP